MAGQTTNRDAAWLAECVTGKIHTCFIEDFPGSRAQVIHRALVSEAKDLLDAAETADAADLSFLPSEKDLGEGYAIDKSGSRYVIRASRMEGYLYGLFALYRILRMGGEASLPLTSVPSQNIRMINQWDNFDGSIERGYAGESIFYDHDTFRGDRELIRQYARLLCSCGINAISINNVNVHRLESFFVEDPQLVQIRKIADVFGAYGIRVFLCINFAAPIRVGKLDTADPLDEGVRTWWKKTVDRIYEVIPDFGGFLVKADSEGEPGPFAYGRTHADGANMLAEALAPHGGMVIWRCFVYNCRQDWRDRSIDRANSAFDLFSTLDGTFADNVALQIKNGPIDFQIREPVSPLFGKLTRTNQILELQITQEYTGHQIDLCYLVPMWKEVLDFATGYEGQTSVGEVLKSCSPVPARSGIAAVSNIGMDRNWTGNKLAQANLYGYGRLVWDNGISAQKIAEEYVALAFPLEGEDAALLVRMLCTSRETYENYTCPLGVGFMCKPGFHYGVDIDGYEYDRWGTYHYADRNGVGRERSLAAGTGFTRRYSDARFAEYENLATCPDNLLLFLHHVAYTHVLHSGKTVIQHIYDTHFQGVQQVEAYRADFAKLKGKLPEEDYENIAERLDRQLQNAVDWRDEINTYFFRKSGIPDEKNRTIYE